ncbi:MAG: hypothetical protein PHQ19_05810, partial [Candidatus Krumholzibacteria bacterium]|nr:hypothetical protein [Candidatus Krumholzibacteria bacterium]
MDALRHALGANAAHGHRRTNADKRRAVELALREFPKTPAIKIAEICGVSQPFVSAMKNEDITVISSTRIGRDGKEYQATRRRRQEPEEEVEHEQKKPKLTRAEKKA